MRQPSSDDELQWAMEATEALIEGEPEPEPPESIKERRRQRERDRLGWKARRRAIAEGIVEDVPHDERCMGMGPLCVLCGQKLPKAGDPPQRCEKRSGGGA